MYARSTTFLARPQQIEAGMAFNRDEVMPTLLATEGCIGTSTLIDRRSGRCIVTSAWRTEADKNASIEKVGSLRSRMAEILGASTEVDEWEIAVLHRDHRSRDGACARVTWLQVDPSRMDRLIDIYKVASLPALEELEGFCSASLMVNRETGRTVSTVAHDSLTALEHNREQTAAVRAAGTKEAGAEVLDVCEFELVLAHLHVPELT